MGANGNIAITPEMVEAGARVLHDAYDCGWPRAQAWARETYLAMAALAPSRSVETGRGEDLLRPSRRAQSGPRTRGSE